MLLATKKMIADIDDYAEKKLGISGTELMYNAGKSAANAIAERIRKECRVLIMCGAGKNGGDGYVIGSELFDRNYSITVFESSPAPKDAASEYHRTRLKKKIKNIHPLSDTARLRDACAGADIIVDALFGVGFRGELPTCEKTALRIANSTRALRLAVDIPSGVEADTGRACEGCFAADHTFTMEYIKRGMLIYPAREYVGRIHICSIGVDRQLIEKHFRFTDRTVDTEMIRRSILSRPADSHKGTYGRLMLVCGSDSMTGAAILACEGALRMGVGLCELVCTRHTADIVATRCPEVIYTVVPPIDEWDSAVYEKLLLHSVDATAVVIGCGITNHNNARRLIDMLSSIAGCPMLIDADGLNSLDGATAILERAVRSIVITPHPKEFARLACCDIGDVLDNKYACAAEMSEKCAVTVLLKGASTVIASDDGTRYINTTGNTGLAKGGSGDVLSGMIGALLAAGIPSGAAAALGAHVHGAAAELLAEEMGEVGMLPRDIPLAAARYLASL